MDILFIATLLELLIKRNKNDLQNLSIFQDQHFAFLHHCAQGSHFDFA